MVEKLELGEGGLILSKCILCMHDTIKSLDLPQGTRTPNKQ